MLEVFVNNNQEFPGFSFGNIFRRLHSGDSINVKFGRIGFYRVAGEVFDIQTLSARLAKGIVASALDIGTAILPTNYLDSLPTGYAL